MKLGLYAAALVLCVLPAHADEAPVASAASIEITRNGARPTAVGPAANFTGSVHVDPLQAPHGSSRIAVGNVTFDPGARTAWHTHPNGQILIVTVGVGLVQQWGGPIQEINPGDVVWIPPGVKHWHGASATNSVTHIAIQETIDGRNVDWLEPVTDEQYHK
jgi:quercetin dioxygenase-like cupin family protein